ncbi:MAG: flagellar hook capping FlgD N-terminal domain-containing protein [Terracidiphilus sp.]|jgi:flagellar basal-body rod modification protein FlgD
MAALAGILNHHLTAGQALTKSGATPMDTTTGGTGSTGSTDSSDSSSATISANDFLTLLVTEMQNQDPTADTDPNEYINQLVQVNSLEQLIDINQNLSTALGDGSSGSDGTATTQAGGAKASATGKVADSTSPQSHVAHKAATLSSVRSGASGAAAADANAASTPRAPGNLSVPGAKPAAHRVAHALDGHSRKQSIASGLSGGQ